MNAKVLFVALVALSVIGCDRQMQSESGSIITEEKQAAAPVPPEQTLANQPPAAGIGTEANPQMPAPMEPAAVQSLPADPTLAPPPAEAQDNPVDVPKQGAE